MGTIEDDIERSTLLMYEIGTGNIASEIKSIFSISQVEFSVDGRFLACGSKSGTVSVWAISENLHLNIKQILDVMKTQPEFWSNYPIFLDNAETKVQALPH